MKSHKLILAPAAILAAFAGTPDAQVGQTTGSFTCSVNSDTVPILRAEGVTELDGDIVLTCSGGAAAPAGSPVSLYNFAATLNTPVTSPATVPNSGWTDAVLIVDDPAPANQVAATVTAASGLSFQGQNLTSDGATFDYGTTTLNGTLIPNIFYGRQISTESIMFAGIPWNGGNHTFRITNLYSNATFTNGNFQYVYSVNSAVSIVPAPGSSGGPVTVGPSVSVGSVLNSIGFAVSTGSAPANQPLNAGLLATNPTLPASPSAIVNFNASSPGAMKAPSTGLQNIPGTLYNTDAGFTSSAVPPVLTDYGTRLKAVFNNIPKNISLYTQTTETNSLGTVQLTSPGTAAGSTGLTMLPVTNGSATAEWEAVAIDSTQVGSFSLPVYFAYLSGAPPAPANITVVQSLGSTAGGVQFAQPPANQIQPILFSVNTGASTPPKLAANVDTRPCIAGVQFYSGNACGPGESGLLVETYTDSASVAGSPPSVTFNGGIENTAQTPSNPRTPYQIALPIRAGSATPGVYAETLSLSPASAANSLSVPFSVTVLAQNAPLFELGGFTDALSYQAGSTAPGQLFTIFGNNFGPPSGLVSGMLSSAGILGSNAAGTQVLFDGVAAPLIYVANGQVSGVTPFAVTGPSTQVQIVSNGMMSPPVPVPVNAAAISIASLDGSGGGGAVIVNQDGSINSPSNGASPGDTVVIYASYAGPLANGVTGTDGRTTTSAPYPAPAGPVSVTMGGIAASQIAYFANAPGELESVLQINVTIPSNLPPDPYVPLILSAGGATSVPWSTIAVK